MSSMAGLVGLAIIEERGGGFSPARGAGAGVYSGGGANDAFVVVPLRGSPISSAACKSLALRSWNEWRWLISIAIERRSAAKRAMTSGGLRSGARLRITCARSC